MDDITGIICGLSKLTNSNVSDTNADIAYITIRIHQLCLSNTLLVFITFHVITFKVIQVSHKPAVISRKRCYKLATIMLLASSISVNTAKAKNDAVFAHRNQSVV